jgi:hypothetical protein
MPPDAVPKPPSGCRIAGGDGTCRLRWDAAFDGAAWYRIERSTAADGAYTVVADGLLGRQWEDASATPGTTWWYRVRGGGPAGVGEPSRALTATADPVGHHLPCIVIASPADGTVQQGRPGRVAFEAADVAGLPRPHRVLWLVDGREVGQDQEPPWRHDIRNPQPGPLTITARPLDAEGFAGPDAEVSIAINGAPIRPRLRIVTPRDGAIFHHGSEIVIEVQASADTDGPIVCAIDGAIVAEFSGSPLRCTWKAERPGVHVVEVRATGTKTEARHGFAVRDR